MIDDRVSIKTVSRFFWKARPPYGIWTAGLLWTENGLDAQVDLVEGKLAADVSDSGPEQHNIRGDVLAVLEGLRRAQEVGTCATVYSTNDSVVRTIPEYYDGWRTRKWKSAKGKTPDSLEEWHEISEICQSIDVEWVRRKPGKIDAVADHEEFDRLLKERDNDFWMERAIARDPY
jgi:ribonuclease HI